jgi:hypothetical protein
MLLVQRYYCYCAQQDERLPDFMWGAQSPELQVAKHAEVHEVELGTTLSGVVDSAVIVSSGQCMVDSTYRALQGLRGCSVTAASETLRQDLLAVAQVSRAVT